MSEVYAWPALAGGQASFAETREQARSTGYEDGLREGRSAAKAEVEELKNSLKASLRELPAIGGMLDAQQLRDVRALVLTLTEALIGVELRTNPLVLERLVEEAFQALGVSHAELILRVSEEDAQWLGNPEGLRIEIEPSRRPGALTVIGQELELEFDPFSRLAQLLETKHESESAPHDADR